MPEPSKILVDLPVGTSIDSDLLERMGHPVMTCNGPSASEGCPILVGETCPLVEAAHGVVFELDLDRVEHREILSRYKDTLREDVPIRVVTGPEQAQRYHELLQDVHVLTEAPGVADLDGLAAEVEAADRLL